MAEPGWLATHVWGWTWLAKVAELAEFAGRLAGWLAELAELARRAGRLHGWLRHGTVVFPVTAGLRTIMVGSSGCAMLRIICSHSQRGGSRRCSCGDRTGTHQGQNRGPRDREEGSL